MTDVELLALRINELQGSMLAMECFVNALAQTMASGQRPVLQALYASETTAFRTALMNSTAGEPTVAAFERDVQRALDLLGEPQADPAP